MLKSLKELNRCLDREELSHKKQSVINSFFSKQYIPRRHKDVVKHLNFGLKDVLDWSEMEVATTFF